MPTFDFHCASCDLLFEKTLPFGSKGKPACPNCKSKKTEKKISMPGIAFKGTGFYKTDSQKKTTPAAAPKKTSEAQPTTPNSPNTPDTPSPAPKEANKPNLPKKPI